MKMDPVVEDGDEIDPVIEDGDEMERRWLWGGLIEEVE